MNISDIKHRLILTAEGLPTNYYIIQLLKEAAEKIRELETELKETKELKAQKTEN